MKNENAMKLGRKIISIGGLILYLSGLVAPLNVSAQFDSGSTGTLPLSPSGSIEIALPPDGVLQFTTINIPVGVEVTFTPNAANTPVTLLASGDVTIDGTINVDGKRGADWDFSGTIISPGGAGGPGGFSGGQSGARGITNTFPSPGQGPGGGNPSPLSLGPHSGGKYGAPIQFTSLIPLFGGSGGVGGVGFTTTPGTSGGGGGGAILIASSTKITITGAITANGGGSGNTGNTGNEGGGGSGGAIRLVARDEITPGELQASGGFGPGSASGGVGKIRLEAPIVGSFASVSPVPVWSIIPGPVTATSTPPLSELPTLSISLVGGLAAPPIPTGSLTTADVSLPSGSPNPVTITLNATNTPVGTVFTVRLVPQFAVETKVSTNPSTGSSSSSTASALVTVPVGIVSLVSAFADFIIPDVVALLLPKIDGEPVERVMLAANMGRPSSLILVTQSGKEIPAKTVVGEERLAQIWHHLQK